MPDSQMPSAPPFARSCIEHSGRAWGASFDHPFVLALADGSLDPERFRFYQMQDARYLESYATTAALIGARCPAPAHKLAFIEAAQRALIVESELHAGYGRKLGYTPEDVAAVELGPVTHAYSNHMIATAQTGTLVEAIAALLPCPWLYAELGRHLLARIGNIPDDHPYGDWLALYSNVEFEDNTRSLLELLEFAAEAADDSARARAQRAFRNSTRYEWMFWEQAWTRQQWPV